MHSFMPMRKQAGISLIELMIALVISSFLILGVTTMFLNNKQAYTYQQNQSGNQENGRFALLLLNQELTKAGFRALAQDDFQIAFPAASAGNGCPAFATGQVMQRSTSGNGVCFRYQRYSTNTRDCLGQAVAANATVTTRLEYDATTGTLQCTAQGATGQLLSGLANLQFQYGVDLSATRRAQNFVTVPDAGASIVAVRYSLLFASTANNIAIGQNNYFFPLSSTASTTAADSRVYRSIAGTTTLRNISQ
ncbi:PilW family protein [Pseudomonas nitroreducens]|uniref:PilW family protein n=1 Tax=Pseudomonas nitroreducens TaxID=46680 RepID=UPI002D7EE7B5|nr:PilW family protein [Pseudomonas nitroreducens]